MSNTKVKSSDVLARVSARMAQRFLENLARLDRKSRTKEQVASFHDAFQDILAGMTGIDFSDLYTETTIEEEALLKEQLATVSGLDQYKQDPAEFVWDKLQPFIREVWKERDPFAKECALLRLAGVYMVEKGKRDLQRGQPALLPDKFVSVVLYALKNAHLMCYCHNLDCKRPYFMAARASQRYCSAPCARPAQRLAKKRWWDAHKEEALRKRSEKRKRGKHAKAKKA